MHPGGFPLKISFAAEQQELVSRLQACIFSWKTWNTILYFYLPKNKHNKLVVTNSGGYRLSFGRKNLQRNVMEHLKKDHKHANRVVEFSILVYILKHY